MGSAKGLENLEQRIEQQFGLKRGIAFTGYGRYRVARALGVLVDGARRSIFTGHFLIQVWSEPLLIGSAAGSKRLSSC